MLRFMTWRTLRSFTNNKLLNSLINQTQQPEQILQIYNSKKHLFDNIHRNTILKKILAAGMANPSIEEAKQSLVQQLTSDISRLNNHTYLQFLILNKKHNLTKISEQILQEQTKKRAHSLQPKQLMMLLSVSNLPEQTLRMIRDNIDISALPHEQMLNLLQSTGHYRPQEIIKHLKMDMLTLHQINHFMTCLKKHSIIFNVAIIYDHMVNNKLTNCSIRDIANFIDNIADHNVRHEEILKYVLKILQSKMQDGRISGITSYDCCQILTGLTRLKHYDWHLLTILDDNLLENMRGCTIQNLIRYMNAHMSVQVITIRKASRQNLGTHHYSIQCEKFNNRILTWLDILQLQSSQVIKIIQNSRVKRRSTQKLMRTL